MLQNKILLITGGTGSFGNAVLTRLLKTDIKEIRIFSRDEKKQDDMRKIYQNEKLKFYIGDIRNIDSIQDALDGVDFVFHAAALKQVPSCEFFPKEALLTNIIGSENVLRAGQNMSVNKIIFLSTDKAAYPINAMGISKAMMEKIVLAKMRNLDNIKTTASITRYGNVMATRGSVIPLFIKQIKANKVLTITNPNMTRFLMNLDEAIDLVLYAFKNGSQGDLFVHKAPASTIMDLATALKELFNSSIELKVIGVRNGEKIHETLLTAEERARSDEFSKFFKIPAINHELPYDQYFTIGLDRPKQVDAYTSENTQRLNIEEIKTKLLTSSYVREELGMNNL